MSNTITGAEIFGVGEHNGAKYDEAMIDGVVDSFNALGQSGRVPCKVGHSGKDPRNEGDGKLSDGWVKSIRRAGDKLLADIVDIPDDVYQLIKAGRLKFCSVELLKNVKAANTVIPWVLDAVALLGATRPAVGNLRDLQALTMARRLQLVGERVCFNKRESAMNEDDVIAANRVAVAALFDAAIVRGRLLPAAREIFMRQNPTATPGEAEAYIKSAPRAPDLNRRPAIARGAYGVGAVHMSRDAEPLPGERVDQTLARLTAAHVDAQARMGRIVSFTDAARAVFVANKELAAQWQTLPDEDGGAQ